LAVFFASRRRHTSFSRDWSSDVCSSDLKDRAVARADSREGRAQIVVMARDGAQKAVVSSDRYESASAVFSRDGKWLYFLSDREIVATPRAPWGDRNMGPGFGRRTRIYALALPVGNRAPFHPHDDPGNSGKAAEK